MDETLVPVERFITKSEACNDMQDCLSKQIELTFVGLVVGLPLGRFVVGEAVTGASVGASDGRYVGAW